jgi:hypothetical protein
MIVFPVFRNPRFKCYGCVTMRHPCAYDLTGHCFQGLYFYSFHSRGYRGQFMWDVVVYTHLYEKNGIKLGDWFTVSSTDLKSGRFAARLDE